MGYSDLEIAQKRNALENVLIPDTPERHIERLQNAGFGEIRQCFRCFNFVSLLAIKS
jgi:tRNA (cmo5U34)-methyltransferase